MIRRVRCNTRNPDKFCPKTGELCVSKECMMYFMEYKYSGNDPVPTGFGFCGEVYPLNGEEVVEK